VKREYQGERAIPKEKKNHSQVKDSIKSNFLSLIEKVFKIKTFPFLKDKKED